MTFQIPRLPLLQTHMSPQAGAFQPSIPSPQTIKTQLDSALQRGLTQRSLLAHCLHQTTSPFASTATESALRSAVIVCLDAEWYEHSPSHITELGISILLPDIVTTDSQNWVSAWKVARHLLNFHVRIKPNAHLVNGELCSGHPESFQFGRTSFVDVAQACDLLNYAFCREDAAGNPVPVIFIGHAVDNDISMLATHFDFDISALNTVVATLDTQVMAAELWPSRPISLTNLLSKFGIIEPYLHNAGNDTVTTMLGAMLMAYGTTADYKYLYANYKKFAQVNGYRGRVVGDNVWCTRCESTAHGAGACRVKLACEYCWTRGLEAESHCRAKCKEVLKVAVKGAKALDNEVSAYGSVYGAVKGLHAVPCALCIESTDPGRFKERYAYMHREAECVFRAAEGEDEKKT